MNYKLDLSFIDLLQFNSLHRDLNYFPSEKLHIHIYKKYFLN